MEDSLGGTWVSAGLRRQANHDFASILRAAIDGFWMVDADGRIFAVNDVYCRMSGYSRKELLGMTVLDVDADETAVVLKETAGRIMLQGSDRFERRHKRRDGSIFNVEVSVHHIDRCGGFFIAFMQDTTARRRTEKYLVNANEILERTARDRTLELGAANQKLTSEIAERMRVEEHLRVRASALLSAANAIVITSASGIIEWVNPAFSALTGYAPEEAIGHPPGALIGSGAHDAKFFEAMWKTILAGNVWRGDMRNKRKDGSLYTETMTITPVKDGAGKVTHFIAIKEDTTAERAAAARIRYLNRIYSMLSAINQTIVRDHDPVAVFSEACNIAVDKGGFKLAWIATADKPTGTMRLMAHAGDNESYLEHLPNMLSEEPALVGPATRALRTGACVVCNDIGKDPGGEQWQREALALGYRATASIPLKAGGELLGTLNLYTDEVGFFTEQEMGLLNEIATDLTHAVEVHRNYEERHRGEIAIREQAEVIMKAPVAIIIADTAGKITYCNEGAMRLYGIAHEDLIGHTAEDILSPETLKVFGAACEATFATGSWHGEVTLATRGQRRILVDYHMSLILDEAGKPKARLSVFTDITEKRQFEAQALRAQRVENLGMLAAGIAHDFNNALAPIIMAAPLLRPQVKEAAGQRMLDIVEQSSARGAALVRQMLSFARGQVGEKKLVQVAHILREILDLANSTFPKAIRIEAHLENDLWPVMSDPSQIHQIFLNICVNARDAMPDGGVLTISASNLTLSAAEAKKIEDGRAGTYLKVEVRDTGTGIAPEVLARIWDPFFTTKDDGKGTGLGLSTVRSILRQHNGFVTVATSTAGRSARGTQFSFYLPAVVEGDDGGGAMPPAAGRGNGELILLVDDEGPVREIGSKILVRHGYRTITATDGADAIAVFVPHASEVRLLLTDLDMPIVGGAALTAALRRLNPALPVIAMSGGITQTDTSYKGFASSYLAKPFVANALLAIVRKTLDEAASTCSSSESI
jgi:PAS domain S-box-containing protein